MSLKQLIPCCSFFPTRYVLGTALLVSLILFGAGSVQAAKNADMLKITLGKADVMTLPDNTSDVMVADPKIADISALQIDKLYVVGTKIGNTNILLLDGAGNVVKNMNVTVGVDVAAIENLIHTAFPNERGVDVHVVGSQVALMGSVSTPAAAQKISKLVAAHMAEIRNTTTNNIDDMIENLLEVRGGEQVTLRVRIMEVSRNALKELGLETSTKNGDTTSQLQGALGIATKTGLTKNPFGIASMVFGTGQNGIGDIQLLMNALESDNLTNILAEPNLTAVSGEQAGFLAGGEFPVPTGRDQNGNIVIEYKQFGVSLNFKPIVLSEDRISLQLNTEVSSLDQGQGITLSEIKVPGLDVRRASTTVEINSGGSLMMAGLLKSDNIKGLSGLPGVKDTPVIGDLVSSKSFQKDETELVVIVTPYLVQPYADTVQAKPITLDDIERVLPPPPPKGVIGKLGKEKHAPVTPAESEVVRSSQKAEQSKPVQHNAPMTKVFTKNMQKIYGDRLKNIPADQAYGYMMD